MCRRMLGLIAVSFCVRIFPKKLKVVIKVKCQMKKEIFASVQHIFLHDWNCYNLFRSFFYKYPRKYLHKVVRFSRNYAALTRVKAPNSFPYFRISSDDISNGSRQFCLLLCKLKNVHGHCTVSPLLDFHESFSS
jgi:hypothetical protein